MQVDKPQTSFDATRIGARFLSVEMKDYVINFWNGDVSLE